MKDIKEVKEFEESLNYKTFEMDPDIAYFGKKYGPSRR